MAVVLYDADCGFCRWSLAKLLAWDRRRALRPVALQSPEGRELLADLSEEQRMDSWHLLSGGRRFSAGAALAPALRVLPGGGVPARILERFPAATQRGYRWVARHRGGLARPISGAAATRARDRIGKREAPPAAERPG